VKNLWCDKCGAEVGDAHERENGEHEERSLLRKLLDTNRRVIEHLTVFTLGITCVVLFVLGDLVDRQVPVTMEPPSSLPEWSGKILM